REAGEADQGPDRDAQHERDGGGGPRDLQRERRDREDLPVTGQEEPERLPDALPDQLHRRRPGPYGVAAGSGWPASGTKRGSPYRSTPKVRMIAWVSGATMKSAKARPPAALTRGWRAGLTSMTW